jgi:hypothetical protein
MALSELEFSLLTEVIFDNVESIVIREFILEAQREIRTEMVSLDFNCVLKNTEQDGTLPLSTTTHSADLPMSTSSSSLQQQHQTISNTKVVTELEASVVDCMHCGQRVGVLRYAPHLDKCMIGSGRSSSSGFKSTRGNFESQSSM